MSDVCAKAIDEFQTVINCNSIENASNTPDFILAEFIGDCLDAFKTASNKREKWYGVALEPGKLNGAPSIQTTNSAMVEIAGILGQFIAWSMPTLGQAAVDELLKQLDAVIARLRQ